MGFFRYIVGQYVTIHDDVISHINITQVESTDGGNYACLASNAVGSVKHSARLNVYGKCRKLFETLDRNSLDGEITLDFNQQSLKTVAAGKLPI